MKKTKILITLILLIFCFVLNSELYQSYLTSFGSDYYYVNITSDESSYEALPLYLDDFGNINKRPVFYVEIKDETAGQTRVNIYCTDSAYTDLTEKRQIKNGIFKGAISGTTTVNLYKMTDMPTVNDTVKVYFAAEKYELKSIHSQINRNYTTGLIQESETNGEKLFSIGLWFLFGIVYLLFSGLNLQFNKKELFLKISLGCTKRKAVLTEAAKDGAQLVLSAAFVWLALEKFIYTDFNLYIFVIAIGLVFIANIFIYLTIYRIKHKEILYGGNIGEATVANCYIVKVVSMVLTVLLLSMNIALIGENISPIINTKYIENYRDYEFAELDFSHCEQDEYFDDSLYYSELLLDGLSSGNAVVSINNPYFGDGGKDFIFTNDNSFLIESGLDDFVNNGENIIILPYDIGDEKEPEEVILKCAYSSIKGVTGAEEEDIEVNIVYAEKPSKALYIDLNDKVNAQLGYAVSKNPVYIYFNTDNFSFLKIDSNELWETQSKYALYKNGFLKGAIASIDYEGMLSQSKSADSVFSDNRQTLVKTVFLSVVIILLQLLIDFSLINALIKVEYSANAVELTLKKLMGYSVFRKNRSLIFLNIYSGAIGIMTAVVGFYLLSVSLKVVAVIAGLAVMAIETLILIMTIRRFEHLNTLRIIKGGVI